MSNIEVSDDRQQSGGNGTLTAEQINKIISKTGLFNRGQWDAINNKTSSNNAKYNNISGGLQNVPQRLFKNLDFFIVINAADEGTYFVDDYYYNGDKIMVIKDYDANGLLISKWINFSRINANDLNEPILNFLPRVFYSFYVNTGNIVFDNVSNQIKRTELLMCTKSGTDSISGESFIKGALYQINQTTSSPTGNMLTQFMTPSQGVGKFLEVPQDRTFNDNNGIIYDSGIYVVNQTKNDWICYSGSENTNNLPIKLTVTFLPTQNQLVPLKPLSTKQDIYEIEGIATSESGIQSSFAIKFKHSFTDTVGTKISGSKCVDQNQIPVISSLDYTTAVNGVLNLGFTNNLNENITLNLFIF